MEYTINKLASLAGISTRTLRYYDEVGLLRPKRINSSGYRIYGSDEVNRLQQILFYRELDVSLDNIKDILDNPSFEGTIALKEHHKRLIKKREQINLLIENVEKTIAMEEGRITMTDQEKFEGFKQKMIDDNEKKYGAEIREKYGDEAINKSNRKIKNMSKQQSEEIEKLSSDVNDAIKKAFETGDPSSDLAMEACDLHRQWLSFFWDGYSKEAHAGIAQMYVEDERFKAYYEEIAVGCAEFFRDAILNYTARLS